MNNSDFVNAINESRELINSGKYDKCPCSQKQCEWHGKCFECVLIHRVKKKHVPECLQPIFKDKFKELVKTVELDIIDAKPSIENWNHLKEIDQKKIE